MKTIKITMNVEYYIPYVPQRCRKVRYEPASEDLTFKVRSVTSEEAPVAFRLTDYSNVSNGTPIRRAFKKKLYKQYKVRGRFLEGHKDDDRNLYPQGIEYMRRLVNPRLSYEDETRTKDYVVNAYKQEIDRYLIIDGEIWERCGEPRYEIVTFGLGHNHGGTGLFVESYYNPNLPKEWYFSALDWEKAIAKANEVATRRGDTEDIGKFEKMIEVLMPEMVRIKPLKEHGNGDKFHNTIEAITENSSSAVEAGLLAMLTCFS